MASPAPSRPAVRGAATAGVAAPASGALVGGAAPKAFFFVATTAILLGLVGLGRDFLVPLVVATLLFTLALAITERIRSLSIGGWRPPKWFAYLVGMALVVLGFLAIGTAASSQADAIAEARPRYAERFQVLAGQARDLLGADIVSALQRAVAGVDAGAWLSSMINSVSGALGHVVLVLLYVAFMAMEREAFRDKLPRLFAGGADAERFAGVLRSISTRVQNYMWINTLTSAMSATVAFVILKVIGVQFALTLALAIFLVNFIPNVGSVVGVAIMSLMALLQFDSITPFFIVLVVYGGADTIIASVIQPALQGKSLNLSAFMVMVSLAFWGFMWGSVGAFLAVPMTVATMIVCAEFPQLRPLAVLLSSDGRMPNDDHSGGYDDA